MTGVAALLVRAGDLADMGLNVLTGGRWGQTLSMRAAIAQISGEKWACDLCGALNVLVQRRHCQKQISGEPMSRWNYLRAGACIVAGYGALGGAVAGAVWLAWWAL
jgi:hypothetical protein